MSKADTNLWSTSRERKSVFAEVLELCGLTEKEFNVAVISCAFGAATFALGLYEEFGPPRSNAPVGQVAPSNPPSTSRTNNDPVTSTPATSPSVPPVAGPAADPPEQFVPQTLTPGQELDEATNWLSSLNSSISFQAGLSIPSSAISVFENWADLLKKYPDLNAIVTVTGSCIAEDGFFHGLYSTIGVANDSECATGTSDELLQRAQSKAEEIKAVLAGSGVDASRLTVAVANVNFIKATDDDDADIAAPEISISISLSTSTGTGPAADGPGDSTAGED